YRSVAARDAGLRRAGVARRADLELGELGAPVAAPRDAGLVSDACAVGVGAARRPVRALAAVVALLAEEAPGLDRAVAAAHARLARDRAAPRLVRLERARGGAPVAVARLAAASVG